MRRDNVNGSEQFRLESEIIGAMILDERIRSEIATTLKGDEFTVPLFRASFHVLADLANAGGAEELQALEVRDIWTQIPLSIRERADEGELVEAVRNAPLVIKAQVETIRRNYLRRLTKQRLQQLLERIERSEFDAGEVQQRMARLEYEIDAYLQQEHLAAEKFSRIVENRIITLISSDPDRFKIVQTGITGLDALLPYHGYGPSALLNIIAARPGVGKSALLMTIALNIARRGKRALFFSLEMSEEQLADRALANLLDIPMNDLETTDERKLMAGYEDARRVLERVVMDVTPAIKPSYIRLTLKKLEAEGELPDAVFVDYIQLMRPDDHYDNRVQEIGAITVALRGLAKEFSIPFIVAAQLSRDVEKRANKHPRLSDLRESGSLEQDADTVLFIYREIDDPLGGDPNSAELILAKNRNGEVGTVYVEAAMSKSLFRSLSIGEEG